MKTTIRGHRGLISLFLMAAALAIAASTFSPSKAASSTAMSIEERVVAQRAIEKVYWRHREKPAANATGKAPLSQVISEGSLRQKALDGVRMSNALEALWHDEITGARLQAEIKRMVRSSRKPEVLRELFAALGNNPHRIAECLARPLLAARLLRSAYAGTHQPNEPFDVWWQTTRETMPSQLIEPAFEYKVDMSPTGGKACDDSWQPTAGVAERSAHTAIWTGSEMLIWGGYENKLPGTSNTGSRYDPATDTWSPMSDTGAPTARGGHTVIWTGQEMIVWGGNDYETSTYYNTGGRYNPATDSWTPTSTTSAPFARINHTAVWTGTEMIVWGGSNAGCLADPTHCLDFTLNAGGRYNPSTNSWTPISTSSQPSARWLHTAVWTGSAMIVWGGSDNQFYKNDGGNYDPATDTWAATSTTGAPQARDSHRAVWTGSEMIIWGGFANEYLGAGARYNPNTDSWVEASDSGAPAPRSGHTSIWTGTELIIWGGIGEFIYNDGARYNPQTDAWQTITDINAPGPRDSHTAVWTGNEMVVWGGSLIASYLNSGGRYNPATNSWLPTSTEGAPEARYQHTAIWTGAEMIIWGGCGPNSCGISFPNPSDPPTGSGGRYDPATDTWMPTSLLSAPPGRKDHIALWTGSEMIVWGGSGGGLLNNGARYNPATDTWVPTSIANAPTARGLFTAVWTGQEMIVWGGYICADPPTCDQVVYTDTGGRYNPTTDSWTATETTSAATGRVAHFAVWTGKEMVIWGGYGCSTGGNCVPNNADVINTGSRYNPSTHTWAGTSTTNAPSPRDFFTGVWTGAEMIVWGGTVNDGVGFDTGGRYNPATNSWTPTNTSGAPVGRTIPTSVWTGNEMIIWGGYDTDLLGINSGGRYNPTTDSWQATTLAGAPYGRELHTAVWSGSEMIVWGGRFFSVTATGGRYCAAVPSPVVVNSVVSRKAHGSAGAFDVDLPLTGPHGVECRTGGASGNHQLIFNFANSLTSVSGASVTNGTGTVTSAAIGSDPHQYIVNLTGVTNGQTLTVTLAYVNDAAGNSTAAVPVSMDVLLGDTNADRSVNSADISQTKSQSGQTVTSSNFREDVTTDGSLNSADISLVKSKSGTGLAP